MKKILLASLVVAMVFSFGLVAGEVLAFPESGRVGQDADEDYPEGTVTRVEFDYVQNYWYMVMPSRGDFDKSPHLDDGWIINVFTDRQGHSVLYIMVHEDDPRYSDDLDPAWGEVEDWGMFKMIVAGKYYSGGQ